VSTSNDERRNRVVSNDPRYDQKTIDVLNFAEEGRKNNILAPTRKDATETSKVVGDDPLKDCDGNLDVETERVDAFKNCNKKSNGNVI
jgi:hypothetical protein